MVTIWLKAGQIWHRIKKKVGFCRARRTRFSNSVTDPTCVNSCPMVTLFCVQIADKAIFCIKIFTLCSVLLLGQAVVSLWKVLNFQWEGLRRISHEVLVILEVTFSKLPSEAIIVFQNYITYFLFVRLLVFWFSYINQVD